jgi:hypothetical protein
VLHGIKPGDHGQWSICQPIRFRLHRRRLESRDA